jgi:hypothetical protein
MTPAESNGHDATKFVGLSSEEIDNLLGGGRLPAETYENIFQKFLGSDEPAVWIKQTWKIVEKKEASTLYQAFNKEIKKAGLEDKVLVKRSDEDVALLHLERLAVSA